MSHDSLLGPRGGTLGLASTKGWKAGGLELGHQNTRLVPGLLHVPVDKVRFQPIFTKWSVVLGTSTCITLRQPSQTPRKTGGFGLGLQVGKLRFRAVKGLAQGHQHVGRRPEAVTQAT